MSINQELSRASNCIEGILSGNIRLTSAIQDNNGILLLFDEVHLVHIQDGKVNSVFYNGAYIADEVVSKLFNKIINDLLKITDEYIIGLRNKSRRLQIKSAILTTIAILIVISLFLTSI